MLDLDPPEAVRAARLPIRADVADAASLDAAMAQVAAAFGGIDILVNSAGISAVGDVSGNDDAEWARVLDVNVTGVARACRAALPYLRRSEHAVIVNLSSIAATAGLVQRALYSAVQGRRARAHARHGGRSGRRGRPRVLRRAGHGRHALGRPAARSSGRSGR